MKVVIDGVEYMPACAMTAGEGSAARALEALLTLRYLYSDQALCRGGRGCIHDALAALRPGVEKLDADEVRHLWQHLYGEDEATEATP